MIDNWHKEQPPWIVFPTMEPVDLRASQGAEEVWLSEVWWPFWLVLNETDRTTYLQSWQCTEEWRDYLEYHTRLRDNYNEAEDVEDRKRFLAEQESKQVSRPSKKSPGFRACLAARERHALIGSSYRLALTLQ